MEGLIPAYITLVEGADGTGKTTFAERQSAGGRLIHNGPPPRHGSLYRHYRAQILDAIWFRDRKGISTVIDRSFLSEYIYGPVYRKKSRITRRQVRKLEQLCLENDVLLLGMTATDTVRVQRLAERGERFGFRDHTTGRDYGIYFQGNTSWVTVDSSSTPTPN